MCDLCVMEKCEKCDVIVLGNQTKAFLLSKDDKK